MACKGKFLEKEAERVISRNWELVSSLAGISLHAKCLLQEAIRRAMLRAYKRGLEDGKCPKNTKST